MESLILALDLKITDKDRKNIPSLDIQSAPCNNFCNSIFSALRICYNTICVLKMDHFPVYSYVRMLLNNDQSDLLTWANTRCFYPDDEDAELDSITCKGWKKRREMFGGELKIPPKLDENTTVNPDYATKNGKFAYKKLPSFFLSTTLSCQVLTLLWNWILTDLNFAFKVLMIVLPIPISILLLKGLGYTVNKLS